MKIFVEGLFWKIAPFIHMAYTSAATPEEKMATTMIIIAGVAIFVAAALTLDWLWHRHKRRKQALKGKEGVQPPQKAI